MDLWIRSQDKMNLVKVNQVNVNYTNNMQIIANYIPDFIGKEGEYYELLGTYKTKERSLEVLDEIQSAIEHNGVAYYDKEDDALYNLHGVYEMPEE